MANKDYNHLFKLLIIGDSSQWCLLTFTDTSGHMVFVSPPPPGGGDTNIMAEVRSSGKISCQFPFEKSEVEAEALVQIRLDSPVALPVKCECGVMPPDR